MPESLAVPKPLAPAWLTTRLGLMFLLEVASIAAYAPLLSLHMQHALGLSPYEMSLVYATGPVTSLIAPLLMGFAADRLLPAEKLLSVSCLLRAGALVLAARSSSFGELLVSMALVGLCATPSLVLSSSICLHHMPDPRRMGHARVFGAASWIVTLWAVSAYLGPRTAEEQTARLGVGLLLSAALAAALGLYALTLPHTPPARVGRGPLEGLAALRMLRNKSFLALLAVTTACGALFQINLILQGLFFTSPRGLGLDPATANRASSVSQLLELGLFPALSALLIRFGAKPVLLVGVLAWPLRFGAYAWGQPVELVIFSQLLHGVSVVLGYFSIQIAVDEIAPRDLRASAQALLAAAGGGVGALSGQVASGVLLARYGGAAGPDWRAIFTYPLLLAVAAVLVLALGYRPYSRR